MLSTTNQLDAYKELTAAGGMTTPPSIEKSVEVVTNATAISTLLTGLFLSTVEYPATISTSTAQISSWASLLSELAKSADAHVKLLRGYADPSALIQLSIGWDVYCRANDLAATELPVSQAIADETRPENLRTALSALNTSPLKEAMDAINTALSAGAGGEETGGGETGGTTSPTLTDDQIKALNDAVEGFTIPMANVTAAGDELKTIYEGAASSSNTAQTAYSNAISVALVNASVNDSTVASAITAITPATVLNALKGGS
ncbi:hypothetical protein EBP22_17270 [Salmonella enterica subsp. enterica serovar Typhimurium]|uniref:hypothetical protein n=1 Tax=Citrobacter TaxID=544 RepID=UPI001289F2F6|nr:hypothetical protein [Citrobacter portucalensis]EBZ5074337.1 hypothetical protein [Salmonella enterica subsp. enterica serovar Typhimurium]EEB8458283.1 hypothetical protein [Salmonella enterica]HEJ0145253.1 hypothetical protein [Citrobacter freundii]ECL7522422.1 hypothetical protein [Salmonella enterica subsp. enterica serovar Typhimurium]EDN3714124.1 hypothetical protein [Salmonella enterica subsp. enterica serovar Typhimurium]